MPANAKPTTLATALLEAQKALVPPSKDAANTFHKYKYVSSEHMVQTCRDALNGAGLTVGQTGWKLTFVEGSAMVEVIHRVEHAASAESIESVITWPVIPDKGRPMDKALASALTTSLSYWLRGLLMVPRPDVEVDQRDDMLMVPRPDEEVDQRDDTKRQKPATKPRPLTAAEKFEAGILRDDPSLTNGAARRALTAWLAKSDLSPKDLEDPAVMTAMTETVKAAKASGNPIVWIDWAESAEVTS